MISAGEEEVVTEVEDVVNEPVESEPVQQQNSGSNIEDLIDRKFGELRGEITGVERRMGEKVEGLRREEVEAEVYENFDPSDPADIKKLVTVEATKITKAAMKESDGERRLADQRRESDNEASQRFKWLNDVNSREYKVAQGIWQKKFGNTNGPIDALMQVALEADYKLRQEADVRTEDNDVRRSKGSYNSAGGSQARNEAPPAALTKNQKSICEQMGISEKEYAASIARRNERRGEQR